jgi:hypothetical protein
MSIPDIIAAIDTDQETWDSQQMNLSCMTDVIQHMKSEQMQEYLEQLSTLTLKMVYSPVEKLSAAGVTLLSKMVEKCGDISSNTACKSFVLRLAAELFDTRRSALVALSTKWLNDFINKTDSSDHVLQIYTSLLNGLSHFLNTNDMIVSETWPAFAKAVFRACEVDLPLFLQHVMELMTHSFVLEAQRYAIYYSLDAIVRSPQRCVITSKCDELIPVVFNSIHGERSSTVVNLKLSVIQHAISCIYASGDGVFDYDAHICKLYFEDEAHTHKHTSSEEIGRAHV